jgi:ligand-binding sensor domain-containing protein
MPGKRNFIYLLLTLLIASEGFLFSQNLRFKPIGTERGLTNKYVYCINQGADGYIWLGSGDGIFRFDGFRFIRNFPGDTLPQRIVVCDYRDSKDRLWFGYRDGSVAVLEGIHFKLLPTPEDKRSSIN